MNVGRRRKKEEETVREAKIAVFDKSSNLNGCEFRHAVFCIVFSRSSSVGRCYKTAAGVIGRRLAEGTKIGNYRVDYNSTRSVAPMSGGGTALAVAVAGFYPKSFHMCYYRFLFCCIFFVKKTLWEGAWAKILKSHNGIPIRSKYTKFYWDASNGRAEKNQGDNFCVSAKKKQVGRGGMGPKFAKRHMGIPIRNKYTNFRLLLGKGRTDPPPQKRCRPKKAEDLFLTPKQVSPIG